MDAKVFVYGTLMDGEHNNHVIDDGRLVGDAKTDADYTMVSLGGFPGAIANGGTAIVGEIWEVDDHTMERLDILEGHPRFYQREEITVTTDAGEAARCWIYLLPIDSHYARRSVVITGGDWREVERRRFF